ncbi:hypothetical protein GCM10010234_17790 [Streptomyces hawaiiensis]
MRLPIYRDHNERDPENRSRAGWRQNGRRPEWRAWPVMWTLPDPMAGLARAGVPPARRVG